MANLLFLIGNGFDLNCGIKSKYKHAYDYYLSKTTDDSETIKKFKKDLLDNHENWADFEIGISKYAQNLSNESELIECIRDFRRALKNYLTIEEQKFYEYVNSVDGLIAQINKETSRSLDSFYEGISYNISSSISQIDSIRFITFNYTAILDNIIYFRIPHMYETTEYNLGCLSDSVVHIHGSFHNTTPVLGVDRIDQLNVSYDLSSRGKRTIIKPTFNSEIDNRRISAAQNLINTTQYICTFGLSLGLSDLTWRESIISWLNENNQNQLFVYDYSAYFKDNLEDDERLDEEEELKLKLFADWKLDTSSKLWKQIHMPCGNKIFNYKAVINEYVLKKEESSV